MAAPIDSYRKLSPADRQIVLLSAVYYEAVMLTNFKTLLMKLGWRDGGRLIYQGFDSGVRSRLVRAGLWVEEGGAFRCLPALVEPLCKEAEERDLVRPIIKAAREALPYNPNFWPEDERDRRLRRELRFAALERDEAAIFRMFGHQAPAYFGVSAGFAKDMARVLGDRLEGMSKQIKFMALDPLLDDGERGLNDETERYARYEALFAGETQRFVVFQLAMRRIMRGRFAEAEAILPQEANEFYAYALRAAMLFLRGEDAAALPLFEQGLREFKKAAGKRVIHFAAFPGVLHLLLLLREGSPKGRKLLDQQLAAILKPLREDRDWQPVMLLIMQVTNILRGEAQFRPGDNLFVLRSVHAPWFDLFQSLALRWLGGEPGEARLMKLRGLRKRAAAGGYLWYAREAALLLQAWGDQGDYAADIAALDTKPLTDLFRPEAAWERTLRLLREVSAGALPAGEKAAAERELRLAWEVVLVEGAGYLEPKEQKRKSTGWTKGRPVALKRLREEPESFDYLTAQDRAICACIEVEQAGWGWGGGRTEYDLDSGRAFHAAIGHPALLLDGSPVELVQDQPRILVTRKKSGIRIELHPPAKAGIDYTLIHEAGRLRLVEFNAQHQRLGDLLGAKGLNVPKNAEAQVLETIASIAPLITVHSEIGGDVGGEVERVEADPRLYLQMQPTGQGLRINCLVKPLGEKGPQGRPGEGASSIFSEIEGKRLHAQRDLKGERAVADRLFAGCPALEPDLWEWTLEEPEAALETLEQIQTLGESALLEWPQGKPLRLAGSQGLKSMQVRVGAQKDWFGVSGELTLDDGRVMDMARLLELLTATQSRFVQIGEGEFLSLSQELRKRLEAIRAVQDRGRVHPLAAGLLDEALDGIKTKSDKAWKEQMKRLAEANELQPEVPTTLQAELREYQTEGFRWLARLAHWGAGACLADDMGLGKTIQTLALLLARAAEGPALALAPTSVCANWMEEARRFAPTLNPKTFGPGDRAAMLDGAGPFDLIVCSYGLLQSEAESLAKVKWHTIVADEAQAFKNAQTKRSQAIMALSGDFRLITTGTPIENHLGELWNLFRFINPGLLGSHEHFNQRYANPIEQRQDKEAGRQLKRLIRPFILRRLKSDVLSELPERTEITIHVELSDEERVFYEALRRTAIERIAQVGGQGPGDARFQVLAEIMRLRRACCNPRLVLPESAISSAKLQAFGEIVEELRANRHKALVFSQFVDHLSLIREWLDEQKISYQYLDGSTPAKKRQEAVQAFQGGQGELFLISLKAGGAGLNLTAADYVIHLDPWWNPAVEDQASDRAHRIGQQRPVTIYRLVARDTIEERIIDLHRTKRDLADSLLEGAEMAARMGVEEMMALLKGVG